MSEEASAEGIEPISSDDRSMGLRGYIPIWWSSVIVVQGFATSFFILYPEGPLNLTQVFAGSVIGAIILATLFVLNGFPGYEKGIPFAAQTRSAFGIRGAVIPNYLRIIPAIALLGIGNWIGALAINSITSTLYGFGNVWVYFFLFTVLNLYLAMKGIDSIKGFDTIAAIAIVVLLSYVAYTVVTGQTVPQNVLNHSGTWGWGFVGFIAVVVGNILPGALNGSDLSRHLQNKNGATNQILGHYLGVAPPYVFMLSMGVLFGLGTSNPNPVEAMMGVSPNPIIGSLMLILVVIAQISTNLTINIIPPTHVFQDSLGISWRQGVALTCVLSIATFPWMLFTNSLWGTFISLYSVFLGPIVGVMLADYWIVRKRDTDVPQLYDKTESSKFWFFKGFSIAGIASIIIGTVVAIPVLDLSWMVSLPVGFVSYVVLTKLDINRRLVGSSSVSSGETATVESD